METNLFKKYGKQFILLLFLSLNISVNFTPNGLVIGVTQSFAQEGGWVTGIDWLDDMLYDVNYQEGTYFNNGDGTWSYCPDCAAHVNMDEIIVFGVDMSNTPINLNTSDIWHAIPTSTTALWECFLSGEFVVNTQPAASIAEVVVPKTLSYQGQFTRGTVRPITLQSTVFDCSGWVYFVLLNINPTLANNLDSSTTSIKAYINGNYHSIPQVGDLAVWNGHVEFVVGFDGDYVTLSGSRGENGSAVPSLEGENWLTPGDMNAIANDFLGFWTIQ